MSDADFTAPFEGFSAAPYKDAAGVWTIGDGSTRDAEGRSVTATTQPVSRAESLMLLRRDLVAAHDDIGRVVHVPLTPEEMIALEDFIYNVGAGAFNASTLLRKLNAGDYDGAAAELERWTHAGGRILTGLVRRRAAEQAEFESGKDWTNG